MQTVADYLAALPEDRKTAIEHLRQTISENLPEGFAEIIDYGMIAYVVPHSTFPSGYHCDPKKPLPFISFGSQKNGLVLHHLGFYVSEELTAWFANEYPNHSKTKLDMGKGCVRFKKIDQIPHALLADLFRKITVADWIHTYETKLEKR
jgi:uncharacterized protein YdhG (YjbR/CyaY superfamily)